MRSRRRLAIGLALVVFGLGSVAYAPAFTLVVLAISVGSLYEFGRLSDRIGASIEFTVALLACLAYDLLTATHLIHRYEGVLLAVTVVAALASATFRQKGKYFARSGYTVLAVLYIGKLLSYYITIRAVPHLGIPLTLYACILIATTDVWAMIVGIAIGRHPLTALSPRKTVEGAVGGFVATVLTGVLFALTPGLALPWWEGAAIGAITSLAAQAGDLVESALKREASVKDAGTAIGEHGGVLDRFDSYIFGGIAFYFALYVVQIVPVR